MFSYPVYLPWYGLLLALGICAVLFIPIGIVMAITNQHSSIYLICQLICGAVFPGRPVANMVFVTYGYISSAQGIKFSADLKLGHYMKIPPRILFSVQMVATIVSSITQIGVLNWMFANVPNICTPQAINGFVCPLARVHFNGSILWGVVGPKEFFGTNATYHILVYAFPFGAIAPILLWLVARNKKGHKRLHILRKINLPVLFGSLSWIPPATGLNFSVWALNNIDLSYDGTAIQMASRFRLGQLIKGKANTYTITKPLHECIWLATRTSALRPLIDEIQDQSVPPAIVLKYLDDDLMRASAAKRLTTLEIKQVAKRVLEALNVLHEDGPDVPADHEAYDLKILMRHHQFFGPFPLSYQDIADDEAIRIIMYVMRSVPPEKMRPFASAAESEIAKEDKVFILRIMRLDPRDRPTAGELLGDEWFKQV
ncbi:putative Sexual differentiation process protein isp4 [Glarea lozoyensis 74030]|uniref:Putative Sexual differentiation process protein isp4 n=1 Tax=Glarea lozoyensis (strain ATCC 74030 / MF5533) TaxID=1104152 RepID=H0EVE9_GLAL7|nr:putative Sexual differentiation process protein isp4 [Glarea lozoyensis 74030]